MVFGREDGFFIRYKWLILVVILVALGVVSLFLFNGVEKKKNSTKYVTEFIFKEEGKTIEVRLDAESKKTWLFTNNKEPELLSAIPRTPNEVIYLPQIDDLLDIPSIQEPISELTWESKLEDSTKYLNFLESEGYKVIREVYTSQFIEKVLKQNDKRKRVIILTNLIMIGDLEKDAELADIEEYLKTYRK